MAVADSVTKPIQEEVTHRTWTGQDFMGAATYVDVTRRAVVEQKLHQRGLSDGRMVQVQAKLTFVEEVAANGAEDRVEPIDQRDFFVLKDGSMGPVVNVEGVRDPGAARPFVLEVYLGTGGYR